jgi:hypothetical protein
MRVNEQTCTACERKAKTTWQGRVLCMSCYRRVRRRTDPAWAERERVAARERKAQLGKAHLAASMRDYAERTRGVCSECGGPTGGKAIKLDGSPGNKPAERCQACHVRAKEHRYRLVQNMWLEGWTMPEICEALGYAKGYLSLTMNRMRAEGWELPYRRRRAA